MKAFPLIWNEPKKYQSHIIFLGTFHICGAYLKGIGKRYCQGSGWLEAALEAKLITTGSVFRVIYGKKLGQSFEYTQVHARSSGETSL